MFFIFYLNRHSKEISHENKILNGLKSQNSKWIKISKNMHIYYDHNYQGFIQFLSKINNINACNLFPVQPTTLG